MYCHCGAKMKCIDTRVDSDYNVKTRRYICDACRNRYTSMETIVSITQPGQPSQQVESHELHQWKVKMARSIGRVLFGEDVSLDIVKKDKDK